MWVDKGREFYNRSMISWLEKNDTEMYSTHNEGKSVVAERFIRTLKNEVYKYMTSVSKNVYIDKLDNIVNKYNNTYHITIKIKPADVKSSNTYHITIKMKPVDVKSSTYIDFSKENSNKDPKFKICDNVRVPKYKNIFANVYTPNWSEEVFVIKNITNTVPYVINDLNGEENVGTF